MDKENDYTINILQFTGAGLQTGAIGKNAVKSVGVEVREVTRGVITRRLNIMEISAEEE